MTKKSSAYRWVAVVFAVALVAAACGDDSGGGSEAAADTAAEETETTTTTVAPTFPEDIGPPPGTGLGGVDITLHTPNGETTVLNASEADGPTMNLNRRSTPSGGQFEEDVAREDAAVCGQPFSQIASWPTGSYPSGEYQAGIQTFGGCGAPEAEVRLDIRIEGEVVSSETYTIPVGAGGIELITFDVP